MKGFIDKLIHEWLNYETNRKLLPFEEYPKNELEMTKLSIIAQLTTTADQLASQPDSISISVTMCVKLNWSTFASWVLLEWNEWEGHKKTSLLKTVKETIFIETIIFHGLMRLWSRSGGDSQGLDMSFM